MKKDAHYINLLNLRAMIHVPPFGQTCPASSIGRADGFVSRRSLVRAQAAAGPTPCGDFSSPTSVSSGAVAGYWQGIGVYWFETEEHDWKIVESSVKPQTINQSIWPTHLRLWTRVQPVIARIKYYFGAIFYLLPIYIGISGMDDNCNMWQCYVSTC